MVLLTLLSAAHVSHAAGPPIRQTELAAPAPPSASAGESSLGRRRDEPPSMVFRGDPRGPEEIKEAGGFVPPATDYSNPDSFNLAYSVGDAAPASYPGSAYVPTTAAISFAFQFAGLDGYIYRIHATPNHIDVGQSLPGRPAQEHEFAALGGIRWDQVSAWSWAQTPPRLPSHVVRKLVSGRATSRPVAIEVRPAWRISWASRETSTLTNPSNGCSTKIWWTK